MGNMFQRARSGSRFEMIAAAWGALPPAIALMALSPFSDAVIFSGSLLAFFAGGFLAGIRATRARVVHGAAAALLGVGVYLCFIALTRAVSLLSSTPEPVSLEPSDPARFAILVVAGVALAAAGAFGAGALLSSSGASRLGG